MGVPNFVGGTSDPGGHHVFPLSAKLFFKEKKGGENFFRVKKGGRKLFWMQKKTPGKSGKVKFNKMLRDIQEGNLSVTSDEEEINLMSEHDSEETVSIDSDFEGVISMEDLLEL